jgi:isochorismate pyruvate lyase
MSQCCNSLEEVRNEIDKVDEVIIEHIAERNNLIKRLAEFKNSIEEIKDEDRINAVLGRARSKALALGVSPSLVTEVFTLMIDEMVESEVAELRNAKKY